MSEPTVRYIRWVSTALWAASAGALGLHLIRSAVGWLIAPYADGPLSGIYAFGFDATSQAAGRWIGLAAHLPAILFVGLTLYFSVRLFGCFRKGELFSDRSVRYMMLFACCSIAATVAGILIHPLCVLIASVAGQDISLPFVLTAVDLNTLFFGAVFVVLAWVLTEAKRHVDDVKLIF